MGGGVATELGVIVDDLTTDTVILEFARTSVDLNETYWHITIIVPLLAVVLMERE